MIVNDGEVPRLKLRAERADRYIRILDREVDRLRKLLRTVGIEPSDLDSEKKADQVGQLVLAQRVGLIKAPLPEFTPQPYIRQGGSTHTQL